MTDTFAAQFVQIQEEDPRRVTLLVKLEPHQIEKTLDLDQFVRAGTAEAAARVIFEAGREMAHEAYMAVMTDVYRSLRFTAEPSEVIDLAVEDMRAEVDRIDRTMQNVCLERDELIIRLDELRRVLMGRPIPETVSEPAAPLFTYHDRLMEVDATYAGAVHTIQAESGVVSHANDAAGRDFIIAMARVRPDLEQAAERVRP